MKLKPRLPPRGVRKLPQVVQRVPLKHNRFRRFSHRQPRIYNILYEAAIAYDRVGAVRSRTFGSCLGELTWFPSVTP